MHTETDRDAWWWRPRVRIALLSLAVVILGCVVLLPILLAGWSKLTYDPPKPLSESELRESSGFYPSRVLEYREIIGKTVAETIRLLGYDDHRNLYPTPPVLMGTPSLGTEQPAQFSHDDLIVTAVCQTMTPDQAFSGEIPEAKASDRIYLATFPRSQLTPQQQDVFDNSETVDNQSTLTGWTIDLERDAHCSPNHVVSIAVR